MDQYSLRNPASLRRRIFLVHPLQECEQKYMEQYATQMEAARKGIVTEELKKVAAKERMTTEELMPLVAEGKVVICANRHHKCIDPERRRLHAAHQDQCESGRIPRLQGL